MTVDRARDTPLRDHHPTRPSLNSTCPRAALAADPTAAAHPITPLRGRPRVYDRAALAGIVHQLRTGIPWRLLPTDQVGCGSAITCWRRLRDWQHADVWQQLHHLLLDRLGRNDQLDWSRASLDSLSVRAKRGLPDRPEPDRPQQARLQVPPAR
jgi:transposase